MTLVLARVPALRLLRTPRAWLPIAGWTLLAIVSALVARSSGSETDDGSGMAPLMEMPMPGLVPQVIMGSRLSASMTISRSNCAPESEGN